MGVTFALFQSDGTDPSRRERLKRNARGAARHSPLDWRNLGEILLRPGAEPGFSNFFFTVAALITTFLLTGLAHCRGVGTRRLLSKDTCKELI